MSAPTPECVCGGIGDARHTIPSLALAALLGMGWRLIEASVYIDGAYQLRRIVVAPHTEHGEHL